MVGVGICVSYLCYSHIENKSCRCKLCRHWWHRKLSQRQPAVLPMAPKLVSWHVSVFIVLHVQYCILPIYRAHIQHDSAHNPTITVAKLGSNFALTNDTSYLALTGELWGVFREWFKEKWPRYIESALYRVVIYCCLPRPICFFRDEPVTHGPWS